MRGPLEWWVGLLSSLPFAYPGVPFYWLSLIAFLLVSPRIRVEAGLFYRTLLLIVLGLLASVLSPFAQTIATSRAVYSTGFYVLVFFGCGVVDRAHFWRGLLFGIGALSAVTIVLFLGTHQYRHGVNLFIYPSLRDWGAGMLPDWPNYLAFLLGFGGLLGAVRGERFWVVCLCLLGAVATTSRTGILAVIVAGLVYVSRAWRAKHLRMWLLGGAAVLGMVVLISVAPVVHAFVSSPLVQARLLKSSDRVEIYRYAVSLVGQHPTLGVGAVVFDESVGAPSTSFHNGYLEQLVRSGILGFLLWVSILFPVRIIQARHRAYLPLFAYFAIASMFNTIFKEPHLFLIYSVMLASVRGDGDGALTYERRSGEGI